ncbi:MAG: bifunctional precorrin-2 dehydrogenase/sirohydrochlorin ferrochelatase [Bacteroidota bacterium]
MEQSTRNPLYPIFLKLHELKLLIVGAGEVGYEKLSFILKSSPRANITIVTTSVNPAIKELLRSGNFDVTIINKPFHPTDIKDHDLVIAATNFQDLNAVVRTAAKAKGKLVNVADTPDLCDFYLGSIVTRGPLKVAISTNGQSPTFAKRFRQVLEEILPEEVEDLIQNLKLYRDQLSGDFEEKVKALNEATESLIQQGKHT